MNKLNLGLIGYGNVGSGVVKFLRQKNNYIRSKFNVHLNLKTICDIRTNKRSSGNLKSITLTKNFQDVIRDPEIDVVVELIGGLSPAREIVSAALKNGKHVVTANKGLICEFGKSLFQKAHHYDRNLYFESAVMAGVPTIKMISEGIAGNQFKKFFGIINGTCNYILSAMAKKNYTFNQALAEAQKLGFAEPNPKLDINGMDSAYKLAILVTLAFGKFITVRDVYTEGITKITHLDIEAAENMGLCIKLLATAKKVDNELEMRVHPTLISKEHPLAHIGGVLNAIFLDSDPLGKVLLSGEGAGQMAAATGVVSDLINLALKRDVSASDIIVNSINENKKLKVKKMDNLVTKYYLRFMAIDKPGVLSKISGILSKHGISINSVTQKAHVRSSVVPVIMLTDFAKERMVAQALKKIQKLPIVKENPFAIRLETLK